MLPFDEKFQFEFPDMTNGTLFSGLFGKEDNLAKYTKIFGNFSPGISVLFGIGISGITR